MNICSYWNEAAPIQLWLFHGYKTIQTHSIYCLACAANLGRV